MHLNTQTNKLFFTFLFVYFSHKENQTKTICFPETPLRYLFTFHFFFARRLNKYVMKTEFSNSPRAPNETRKNAIEFN